ncbi:hypothetical protein [Amorphus sp. 3PC139-8]|uniref:hypothetical protein n=1 Tax=Amorphus sp. 3PC139-8 TaxID=2735676 RepID=UPI00345D4B54
MRSVCRASRPKCGIQKIPTSALLKMTARREESRAHPRMKDAKILEPESKIYDRLFYVSLSLIILIYFLIPRQAVSGDEPRYLLYATSLWRFGTFSMPLTDWQAISPDLLGFRMETLPYLGTNPPTVLGHPVYVSFLLAPLSVFSLFGLRAAALLIGVLGLVLLHRLLRRAYGPLPALLAMLSAVLYYPLNAYFHTFYSEVFIFAALSAGLLRLTSAGKSVRSDAISSVIILIIPFIHLRASVVGATVFCLFLLRIFQATNFNWKRLVLPVVLAGTALLLLISLNFLIYGTITGSVNTARPPAPWDTLSVLAMQTLSIKGFLPYAPIWLLGYAGLLAGAIRKNRLALECAVLILVAFFTSIGINPGEGWPGRFFVTSVPMLAVGFAWWLANATSLVQRVLTVALALPSIACAAVFFADPNFVMEGRQADVIYQRLYDIFGGFNPGLFLPVEGISPGLADLLGIVALIFVVLAAASALVRHANLVAAVPLLAVIAFGTMTAVRPVNAHVTPTDNGATATLDRPARVLLVEYGPYWKVAYAPPTYARIDAGFGPEAAPFGSYSVPASPVFHLQCADAFEIVRLASDDLDLAQAIKERLVFYEPTSPLLTQLIRPVTCTGSQ